MSGDALIECVVGPVGEHLAAKEGAISVQPTGFSRLALNAMLSTRQQIGLPLAPIEEGPFVLKVRQRLFGRHSSGCEVGLEEGMLTPLAACRWQQSRLVR
jgi:hypothetical protein